MKKASDVFASIREQKANPTIYADIEKRPTVISPAGPVTREQHSEEGRFKPVKPHNVKSVAVVSPRPTSDSANVKLKEETMELNEGKMGQIHADIGEKLDKHIADYKTHGGAEHLGAKTVKTAGHIAKLHGIEQKHAQKFVNDYVESKLKEEVELEEGISVIHTRESMVEKIRKMNVPSDKENHKQDAIYHLKKGNNIRARYHMAKIGIKSFNEGVELEEGMELAIETKKLSTAEKLNRGLKRGGYDADATQAKLKKIDDALKAQHEKYVAQGTLKEEEYWKKKSWQKKMADAAKKQNRKKEDLPFTPDEPAKKQAVAGKYGSGYSTARHLARMAARKAAGLKEETLEEGRPSQRHPLEGHDYHKKTNAELIHIAKDAHAAAEAMKSHNTAAENKYRDQASDSATVRHWRKMNGTPAWYQKKYGIKESNDACPVCGQTPCNCTSITEAWDQPDYSQSIKARQAEADKKSRKAAIVRAAHEKAKQKKKTVKESPKDKFEADPELSTQINRND